MIGGNTTAILQQKSTSETNSIGERVHAWSDIATFQGWLDFSGGDNKYTYDAKLQETTHVFITDYSAIDMEAKDKRLVVNGKVYEVLMIDDPMDLHQHLEFMLKYVG